jgi:hypothetical protein
LAAKHAYLCRQKLERALPGSGPIAPGDENESQTMINVQGPLRSSPLPQETIEEERPI